MTTARLQVLACVVGALLLPSIAPAQGIVTDNRRATELGIVHEWFHRELEPSVYEDTEWSITSLQLSYAVVDWFKISFQGGYSEFEPEDFGDSRYKQYCVGGGFALRAAKWGEWDIETSARYLDTFDLDTSPTLLHKRVTSIDATAQLARSFSFWSQSARFWAGPQFVNDKIETFAWDSTEALESSSGTGWGAQIGARFILGGWIAVYGVAAYIDDIQGGVGISLHASDGGL